MRIAPLYLLTSYFGDTVFRCTFFSVFFIFLSKSEVRNWYGRTHEKKTRIETKVEHELRLCELSPRFLMVSFIETNGSWHFFPYFTLFPSRIKQWNCDKLRLIALNKLDGCVCMCLLVACLQQRQFKL